MNQTGNCLPNNYINDKYLTLVCIWQELGNDPGQRELPLVNSISIRGQAMDGSEDIIRYILKELPIAEG